MRILIVEDEIAAGKRLMKLLAEISGTFTVIGPLPSIAAVTEWFAVHPAPDLILLDIELSDGNSFALFTRISIPSMVIFTTSYDQFALEAFAFNSIDYLLKPISKEALEKSLQKYQRIRDGFIRSGTAAPHYFLVQHGQTLLPVGIDHIAYFYADNRLCYLTTVQGSRYIISHTIGELEEMLGTDVFFRVNRAYLVRKSSINSARRTLTGRLLLQVTPASRKDIYISKERVGQFKEWLGRKSAP